jgi:predicted DNA-binding transcriptional regulator AlpA
MHTKERLVRRPEALSRFSVGHTFFNEKIEPRLTRVRIGPRAVGYTESSIDRVVAELIAEGRDPPKIVPPPNKRRRAAAGRRRARHCGRQVDDRRRKGARGKGALSSSSSIHHHNGVAGVH